MPHAQLTYDQFLAMCALKPDHYSMQLCRVFDADNSGKIGFRECAWRLQRCDARSRARTRELARADAAAHASQIRVQPGKVPRQQARRAGAGACNALRHCASC